MSDLKKNFLKNELLPIVKSLTIESQANWVKMIAQQMLEHVSDFFDVSSGKRKYMKMFMQVLMEKRQTLYKPKTAG